MQVKNQQLELDIEQQSEVKSFSRVQLFATTWTLAHQAHLSLEFSRQEYWSGLHSFLQGIFLTQGSNLGLLHYRQILYHLSHLGSPGECYRSGHYIKMDFNKLKY